MFRFVTRCLLVAALMAPAAAFASPITLKLSLITSDRSPAYRASVKPFVDAVNAEGNGLVHIKVYFNGAISGVQARQPQLVSDGSADLAVVVPGYTPSLFPDSAVLELPGLFHNETEASLVFTRLVAAHAFKGFDDDYVVGASVSQGESIHSRKPIPDLKALSGQIIRVNNPIEADTLQRFGAIPALLPIEKANAALSQHKIDGATAPPAMLFAFGIGRVTSHHYMLHLGGVPVALIMNRKRFESLPPRAQAIIRKYSGEWLARRSAALFAADNRKVLAQLEANKRRQVVFPTPADRATSQAVFNSVIESWTAESPNNRALLGRVRETLATLRGGD